jgi:murein DD-endopeptidase MepM/ murein hydrolase activator NlpD
MIFKMVFRLLAVILLISSLAACGQSPDTGNMLPIATNEIEPVESPTPQKLAAPATPSPTIPAQPIVVQPSITPTATPTPIPFRICSPLDIHSLEELPEITSDPYRPPPPGREERHHGVDFSYYRRGERTTIQGVGVQAVLAGRVIAAISESFPYGNVVIIETAYADLPAKLAAELEIPPGESIYTLYAHMEQAPLVALGDIVLACQALGQVGKSGNAYEPHLHLEMRLGAPGAEFTSMGFYKADDTEEERSNYVRWRTSGDFRHFDPMRVLQKSVADPSGAD